MKEIAKGGFRGGAGMDGERIIQASREKVFKYYTVYEELPRISKFIKSSRIVSREGNVVIVDFEVKGIGGMRSGRHKFTLYPPERIEEEVLTGIRAGARQETYFEEVEGGTRIVTKTISEGTLSNLRKPDPQTLIKVKGMLDEEFEYRKQVIEATEESC